MATDIKEEFEDYVKKLTTAICKEILLEKMEQLFKKYEEESVKLCEASKNVLIAGESLQKEVKFADTTVKKIDADTGNILQDISQDIVSMEDNINMMFEEMRELNLESKHDFITELQGYISNYKKEIAEAIDQGCEQISEKVLLAEESLQKEVKTADEAVRDTVNTLQGISQNIVSMEDNVKMTFEEMQKSNVESSHNFIVELNNYISNYKEKIAETIDWGCGQISDKFAGAVTAELLQEFMDKLEENTKKSKELASFVNDTYKEEIKKSIREIISDNKAAQDQIHDSINAHIQKVLDDLAIAKKACDTAISRQEKAFSESTNQQIAVFAKYLNKFLLADKESKEKALDLQSELIKQIGPSDKKMGILDSRIDAIEKQITEMKNENTEKTNLIIKSFNNYMEEQKALKKNQYANQELVEKCSENFSWKIYMGFSNLLLTGLFVMLLVLQKPWEILGTGYTIGIAVVFISITLLVWFLRRKIADKIVEHKVEEIGNFRR